MACGLELEGGISKCPLCREPLTAGGISKDKAQVTALAERGVSWAQTHAGKGMIDGASGFKKQEKAGLGWINKAVAQNCPSALFELSLYYRDGIVSGLGKSQEKANELLMRSANLGNASANAMLGRLYSTGRHGFEKHMQWGRPRMEHTNGGLSPPWET